MATYHDCSDYYVPVNNSTVLDYVYAAVNDVVQLGQVVILVVLLCLKIDSIYVASSVQKY